MSRYTTLEWLCVIAVLAICVTRLSPERPRALDYFRTLFWCALVYLIVRILLRSW